MVTEFSPSGITFERGLIPGIRSWLLVNGCGTVLPSKTRRPVPSNSKPKGSKEQQLHASHVLICILNTVCQIQVLLHQYTLENSKSTLLTFDWQQHLLSTLEEAYSEPVFLTVFFTSTGGWDEFSQTTQHIPEDRSLSYLPSWKLAISPTCCFAPSLFLPSHSICE